MDTLDAIAGRRSIRKFKDTPIPEETLRCILTAGIQAPSDKNRQPWQFIVVQGEQKRAEMVRLMREGIARIKEGGEDIGSAEWTAAVMEQAPVTIFVINPYGLSPWQARSLDQMVGEAVDIQSIGAAIQNMLLAAQDLGLGSLWICDVFYAYQELMEWMGETGEMIAAVSIGYANEHPPARYRKSMEQVVRWM